MSGIIIISRSEKGEAAINQNLKEHKNASFKEKILFRQSVSMETRENPLSLVISGKHRYLTPAAIEPIAVDMMTANGAKPGTDYTIEVVE